MHGIIAPDKYYNAKSATQGTTKKSVTSRSQMKWTLCFGKSHYGDQEPTTDKSGLHTERPQIISVALCKRRLTNLICWLQSISPPT